MHVSLIPVSLTLWNLQKLENEALHWDKIIGFSSQDIPSGNLRTMHFKKTSGGSVSAKAKSQIHETLSYLGIKNKLWHTV